MQFLIFEGSPPHHKGLPSFEKICHSSTRNKGLHYCSNFIPTAVLQLDNCVRFPNKTLTLQECLQPKTTRISAQRSCKPCQKLEARSPGIRSRKGFVDKIPVSFRFKFHSPRSKINNLHCKMLKR